LQELKRRKKEQLKKLEAEVRAEKNIFQDDLPAGDHPFESEPDVKMAAVKQLISSSFKNSNRAVQQALRTLLPQKDKKAARGANNLPVDLASVKQRASDVFSQAQEQQNTMLVQKISTDQLHHVFDTGLRHGLDKFAADQEDSLAKIRVKELIREIGDEA